MAKIILPTLRGLAAEGRPYRGILYAGLILTPQGVHVLEFNARWGDPEAQVILPRLETDWVEIMSAALEGRLSGVAVRWRPEAAVCVVLASGGYPGVYRKGEIISGLEEIDARRILLFHAGTEHRDGQWRTRGGRVLGVTATGPTLPAAREAAYQAVGRITFPKMHYRTDIAAAAR